jgi:hypothetical protein
MRSFHMIINEMYEIRNKIRDIGLYLTWFKIEDIVDKKSKNIIKNNFFNLSLDNQFNNRGLIHNLVIGNEELTTNVVYAIEESVNAVMKDII